MQIESENPLSDTPGAEDDDNGTGSNARVPQQALDAPPLTKEQSDEVIEAAKTFLENAIRADDTNRTEALADLRYLSGDQWDNKDKRQRELDRRPCLTINKLPTFLHQVTNDQRQNVPSIKVSPVDSAADVETAQLIQGLIRHIEYSSNADVAYDTAVNSAAAIGFGAFRLITDWCYENSWDQDIRFKRIRNSFTVYMDPLSEEPDGSDQRACLISSKMSRSDFKREYPNATATSEALSLGSGDETRLDWLGADFIRIAEFYRIESVSAEIIQLSNGESGYAEDLKMLPPGVSISRRRAGTRSKVMLYKLTAIEVLASTEIKCKWIPVFPVYGDEIDLDGTVIRSGIIRNARDPQAMYNFWMTSATEEVALRPKVPFIAAEGQLEGYEDDWEAANTAAMPYLEYKMVSLDGQLAPAPTRQPMIDVPQGVLTMAMHANDNIKATTGLFDSSLGARGNATSGLQEKAQQRQGDMANFHYTDNLNRTVRHVGRCIVSMLPGYYDAERIVRIMGEDDKIEPKPINQPIPPEQQKADEQTGAIKTVLNDLTVGEYDITVSSGPSYSTLRQEAVDSMIQLGKSWPKLMDIAGDKVIRAMDWPGATEIAERVERTIPAELRADPNDGDPAPVVRTPKGDIPVDQAAQMLQEMDQQMQQMHTQLQDAQSGIAKARIDNEAIVRKAEIDAKSRESVAEINAVAKNDVAELTGLVQMLIARIPPPPALAADVAGDLASDDGAGAQPAVTAQSAQPAVPAPAPSAAPRRKRISIQAPSGQVYEGTIHDEEVPPAPEAAPPEAVAAPAQQQAEPMQ